MIDKAELRRMSQAERRELARLLGEFGESAASEPDLGEVKPGEPDPDRADPFLYDSSLRRDRRPALLIAAGCCVILAGRPRPGQGPATQACRVAGRTRRAGQPNPSVGLTGRRRRMDL